MFLDIEAKKASFSYQIGYYYVRLERFYHGCTCSVTKGEVEGPPLTILERTSLHFARKMRAKRRKTRDWIETEAGMGFLEKWQGGKKSGPLQRADSGGHMGKMMNHVSLQWIISRIICACDSHLLNNLI